MPISSGAGGHVGVGVDTSIKWVPDGGTDFQSPRDVNSYLQRYLDSHPKVRRRIDEGSWQDCDPEEQLEIQDPQVTTNESNSSKDAQSQKRKNEVQEGTGVAPKSDSRTQKHKTQQAEDPASPRESDIKSQKLKNGLQDDPSPTRISGQDGKSAKLKNEDDVTNINKTERDALQQNNQKEQNQELQPEDRANSPHNTNSSAAAQAETAQQGKGNKPATKSSTCTIL